MGITYGAEIDEFSSDSLCNLVGNAFDSGCCASMILSMMATSTRAHAHASAAQKGRRPQMLLRRRPQMLLQPQAGTS